MADEEPLGRDYTLREELGRGAIGVVRRATRNGGGPPLAAKLLHQRFAGDRDVLRLFLQEEASLRQVEHESIVGLVDVVYERGRLALLMELVDGPTLRRYLNYRGGTLIPSEACSIATQTAAGLAAMHAQGVVHLDLKPENILLEQGIQPPRAKIGDFGIAELLMNAGRGREFLAGTPGYTAPEILAGEAPSAAADVFALGVILTEMVTGARPDPLTKGAEPPAGAPEPLRSLIGQCLAADPRDRPKARTVSALLRQAAPQLAYTPRRPPTAPPDPPPPTHLRANRTPHPEPDRAHRHPKRGLLTAIAATLAVLLLGGIGTAILASNHDTTPTNDVALSPTPSPPSSPQPASSSPQPSSSSSSQPGPSSVASPTTAEEQAAAWIQKRVNEDSATVEKYLNQWILIVSSKQVGTTDPLDPVHPGKPYTNPMIVQNFQYWLSRYPDALLADSSSYTSYHPGFWITIIPRPSPTPEAANAWCRNEGLKPNDCNATRVSHTLAQGPDTSVTWNY